MKCHTMLHFIWVFTVCQSMYLGVTSIKRVKGKKVYLEKLSVVLMHTKWPKLEFANDVKKKQQQKMKQYLT